VSAGSSAFGDRGSRRYRVFSVLEGDLAFQTVDPAQHIERSSLPSLGTMIEDISQARINGQRMTTACMSVEGALY